MHEIICFDENANGQTRNAQDRMHLRLVSWSRSTVKSERIGGMEYQREQERKIYMYRAGERRKKKWKHRNRKTRMEEGKTPKLCYSNSYSNSNLHLLCFAVCKIYTEKGAKLWEKLMMVLVSIPSLNFFQTVLLLLEFFPLEATGKKNDKVKKWDENKNRT